ncbi:methyltransferase family protein [[Eubacterium] cellulosolvens]
MSIVPDFELGLWNAWIITVLGFLATVAPLLISNERAKKRSEGEPRWSELSRTAKTLYLVTHVLVMPFTIGYSIFLPLKLGTAWFYVGISISFLAIIMGFMAGVSFATAPLDEPMTKGIYAISRNPMYLSGFLEYVGIGVACVSWVFLLCAAVWIVSWHILVPTHEERVLLEKYGNAYREYMNRTPRWVGIPKWALYH